MLRRIDKIVGRIESSYGKISHAKLKDGSVFKGYNKLVDNNDFSVYKCTYGNAQIVAAFHYVVVTLQKRGSRERITIYPDYRNRFVKYSIRFDKRNFPDLLPDSHVSNCFVLPFLRESEDSKLYKKWRLMLVTDKCQVYHNFPARDIYFEGYELRGDIARFQESAVWDLPGKKYPSLNVDCDETEEYNPCLPEECYIYHPAIDYKQYGNRGFGKSTNVMVEGQTIKVPRFYFPLRREESNSFFFMGGYEPDYKMSLFGTYRSNKDFGVRTVVFATSDGGRNIYAKYEFADEGNYEFQQGVNKWGLNHGNPVNGTCFEKEYVGSVKIIKRELRHDGPSLYDWIPVAKAPKMMPTNPVTITTDAPHRLNNGNIIALDSETHDSSSWSVLFNNSYSEYSCGNGKLFKVVVIDDYSFYLYEQVAATNTNIACRHIHHINRVRDGWLLGTGEVYPNGWLFYIQMKEADTFSRISAADELKFIRLNSEPGSVQRTAGADLIDGKEQMLIFASDHDTLHRPIVYKNGTTEISRNSTGIYRGKLSDIDNFDKYEMWVETTEPGFFFKKLDNTFIFSGERGEIAVGLNDGNKWVMAHVDEPFIHYYGSTFSFHVIDGYILKIK